MIVLCCSWFDKPISEFRKYLDFLRRSTTNGFFRTLNTPTWKFGETAKDNRPSSIKGLSQGFGKSLKMPSGYRATNLFPISLSHSNRVVNGQSRPDPTKRFCRSGWDNEYEISVCLAYRRSTFLSDVNTKKEYFHQHSGCLADSSATKDAFSYGPIHFVYILCLDRSPFDGYH